MTFVPVETPKPQPKVRITPRKGVSSFPVGAKVFNVIDTGEFRAFNDVAYTVVDVGYADSYGSTRRVMNSKGYVSLAYDCPYVLESETIIEYNKRVVGYVDNPCTTQAPKTMKFNELPYFTVFKVDVRSSCGYPTMQFLKISNNTVLRWDDYFSKAANKYGDRDMGVSQFTNSSAFNAGRSADNSWGIFNNSADCTIIGHIKIGCSQHT
jgi:hypothetical protein